MSKLHFFLAASLGFLALLRPATSSHCERFPNDACQKSTSFVPGYNLIGKGLDITTLSRKAASVVDTSHWQDPDGTCTLCRNPLMGSEMQRMSLDALEWTVQSKCASQTASVLRSELDVADAVTSEVTNDWKADLELPAIRGAFGGSRSKITLHAHEYSQRDSYSFIKHETSCEYYQLRLSSSPSSLTSHFSRDVRNLPEEYQRTEYQRFLDIYGTHYISQVNLGAQERHLTAVRNCKAALNGFTVFDLKDCVNSDASLSPSSYSSKCQQLWKEDTKGNLRGVFYKWRVAVMGGDEPEKVLFGEAEQSLDWMKSAKSHPEVVSYSLIPLHTLLKQGDPRRTALKKAISGYIAERALRRSCDLRCPYNGFLSPEDHCTCMCHASDLTDNMCCAWEQGKARLKFHVRTGADLWGDHFSATDGYVKVFFQGQERRTRVIAGHNSPQWHETLDFGTVTLGHRNTFELEVWDSAHWEDDRLHRFWGELKAGGPYEYTGYLTYGHVKFAYELECAPGLGGPSCQTYSPLRQPTSSAQSTSARFRYSGASGTGFGQKQRAKKRA